MVGENWPGHARDYQYRCAKHGRSSRESDMA